MIFMYSQLPTELYRKQYSGVNVIVLHLICLLRGGGGHFR